MSPDFIDWKETNEADKIDYYNDRKHGIIEIFYKIKLPYKFYEVANALSIIYNIKSFDDYVSELVYKDIEKLLDGTEIVSDCIINKITGEKTDWHEKEESDSGRQDSPTTKTTTENKNAKQFVKDVFDNEMKKSEDREKESLK